jgi:hypothetical protein
LFGTLILVHAGYVAAQIPRIKLMETERATWRAGTQSSPFETPIAIPVSQVPASAFAELAISCEMEVGIGLLPIG